MINFLSITIGKVIVNVSRILNLGNGSTWPGHIALSIDKNFVKKIIKNSNLKIVLIAGTNGKTTTGKLIQNILEKNENRVFQNQSGANLLNGIASSLIMNSNVFGKINYNYAIFEVDENSLPLVLNELTPDYLILLNLFRDQLDRYGEVDIVAGKWKNTLEKLPEKTIVILNADDPQIAYLGKNIKAQTKYFGLNDKSLETNIKQNAADSIYCPKCGAKLIFNKVYFSHLGDWKCNECKLEKPQLDLEKVENYPLPGIYNRYNINAAVLFVQLNNINNEITEQSLKQFSPAFGRQEIIEFNSKKVQLFLSKNPTSFNESLRTINDLGAKTILLALNDRIPDGCDVSWIWDIDFENLLNDKCSIFVSGDRCFDMALRIKYSSKIASFKFQIEEDLKKVINLALKETNENETLYVLPTYSAMLEVRKILTGKKIL